MDDYELMLGLLLELHDVMINRTPESEPYRAAYDRLHAVVGGDDE